MLAIYGSLVSLQYRIDYLLNACCHGKGQDGLKSRRQEVRLVLRGVHALHLAYPELYPSTREMVGKSRDHHFACCGTERIPNWGHPGLWVVDYGLSNLCLVADFYAGINPGVSHQAKRAISRFYRSTVGVW